jgi:hypothetical protein
VTVSPDAGTLKPADQRLVALGAVLARAVVAGELEATHARGVLAHQLRKMNVNSAIKASKRSTEAQAVIDRYAEAGAPIPKNGSDDALHSDHVHTLHAADMTRLVTVDAWIAELPRLKEVVCVTAAENYRLEKLERAGADGWSKYDAAGITLVAVA